MITVRLHPIADWLADLPPLMTGGRLHPLLALPVIVVLLAVIAWILHGLLTGRFGEGGAEGGTYG